MKNIKNLLLCTLLILVGSKSVKAQLLTLPEESQYSETTQKIGLTTIKVCYHSPAVKGRKIFGELVPYGQIWRAGANENTTLEFTHEASINGQKIPAGTYGVHTIPTAEKWTLILSKNHTSWGSYFYKKDEDLLRVEIKPTTHGFTEWLNYQFTSRDENTTTLELQWENLALPIKIDVDVKNTTLANIRNELRSMQGFSAPCYVEAANYCLEKEFNYPEAIKWINYSLRLEPENFRAKRIQAQLTEKTGNKAEADKLMQAALTNASENDLNMYGYHLMTNGKTNEALEIFKLNVKRFPNSWNVYDSLGEAYLKTGDQKNAKAQYQLALKKAPEDRKPVIQKIIDEI